MASSSDRPRIRIVGFKSQSASAPPDVTVFDRRTSQRADQLAIEKLGIPGSVLMENAARHVAEVALELLDCKPSPRIVIVCGNGSNGGDGYAAARHLHETGAVVDLFHVNPPSAGSEAGINYQTCLAMGIGIHTADAQTILPSSDLIIDALFGTGLNRKVEGIPHRLINAINQSSCPVIAVDLPSGLDCDTGQTHGACVKATITVTFIALKPALISPCATDLVGEIVLADIGVSRTLIGIIHADHS